MVYFLQAHPKSPIKIGTSVRLSVRLNVLSKAVGTPLQVLGVMPGGRSVEKSIHRRFRRYRHVEQGKGWEWFRPVPSLRQFIAENAGPWDGTDEAPPLETFVLSVRIPVRVKRLLETICRKEHRRPGDEIEFLFAERARAIGFEEPPDRTLR